MEIANAPTAPAVAAPQAGAITNVRATLRVKKQNTVISPEAGDPLQFFTLIEKVGEGSYGEIYRAMSKSGPQIFALKIIDLEKTEDDIEDLLAEVDFQAKCDSPYLAKYCGSWMWENKLTIGMEYLGGGTLDELIKHCPLSEQQCAFVLREILRGLFYMHKTLKIHRDIKPANILFDNGGSVKLADFGVAAQMTSAKRFRDTFVGTPLYLAPEIVLSLKYGEKVDIWSLGIMAIEIGTGSVPNGDMHPMDILYSIPTAASPKLPENHSEAFRDFVNKCLIKSPSERLSAGDLLKHPFIVQAENLDRSSIKPLLDRYRMKNNQTIRSKMPTTPTANQDDWWQQYVKSTQTVTRAPSSANAIAGSNYRGPTTTGTTPRQLGKTEANSMNARETFGKRGTNRGAKPMQAVGGPMVRGGLRDNSSTMNSMIINPDPPATTAKQASQGYQNNNSGPQPPAPGQARNDSQNATAPIQHQQQQRPLTSNSGAPARQYSPGVNGNSATNLRSSNPSLSGPIINGSREQLNGDGQGQRSRNPSAAHNARVATGEDTYLNFQHPQPSPPKSDPPPATRTRGSSISNSNGAGVVPNKIGNNNNNGSSNNLSQPSQSTLSRISATEGNSNSNMSTSNDSPPTTNLDAIGNNSPKLGPSLAQQAARSRQSSVGPGQPQAPAIQQQLSMGRPLSAKPAASPTAINQQQISPPQPFTLSRSNSDAANAIAPPVGKSPASMGRAASVGVAPKPMDYDSLHVDYRASFSPNFPQRVSPVRFALLRATNDMFESECLYADHLLTVVENYVRPMMAEKNTILKDLQLKAIFANVTKMHTFSLHVQQSLKEFVSSVDSDHAFDSNILTVFEALTNAILNTFRGFGGSLCRNLYETAGIMHDNGKFREFVARQQAKEGVKPLHELLCLPVRHIVHYVRVYQECSRINSAMRLRIVELCKEMLMLQDECSDAVENSVDLISMLFNIADIPPAIILKPKQRMVVTDSVLKLKMGGNNNSTIKKKKPARLYILHDSIILTRVLKSVDPEKFTIEMLLDPKKQFKPPKPCLQYRHIIPVNFAECKAIPDKDGDANMFSITVSGQKGKTTYFASSSAQIKDFIVEALNPEMEDGGVSSQQSSSS